MNIFALTVPKTFVLDSMAFLANIKTFQNTLLGVLNSRLVYFWVKNHVHEYGKSGYRLSNQYVEQLPIPKVSKEKEKEFDPLVEEILFKKSRNQDTTEEERQIDEMVYALYDLTEQEIRIIEEKTSDFWS